MTDDSSPPGPAADPPGSLPAPSSRPRKPDRVVSKGILRWSKWRRATLRAETRATRQARRPPRSGAEG